MIKNNNMFFIYKLEIIFNYWNEKNNIIVEEYEYMISKLDTDLNDPIIHIQGYLDLYLYLF